MLKKLKFIILKCILIIFSSVFRKSLRRLLQYHFSKTTVETVNHH